MAKKTPGLVPFRCVALQLPWLQKRPALVHLAQFRSVALKLIGLQQELVLVRFCLRAVQLLELNQKPALVQFRLWSLVLPRPGEARPQHLEARQRTYAMVQQQWA